MFRINLLQILKYLLCYLLYCTCSFIFSFRSDIFGPPRQASVPLLPYYLHAIFSYQLLVILADCKYLKNIQNGGGETQPSARVSGDCYQQEATQRYKINY
jgi:hypothetical protein